MLRELEVGSNWLHSLSGVKEPFDRDFRALPEFPSALQRGPRYGEGVKGRKADQGVGAW